MNLKNSNVTKTALLFFAVKRYDVSCSTYLVRDQARTGLIGEKEYRLQFSSNQLWYYFILLIH